MDEKATSHENYAPGWPGLEPTWTSSAKSGVGTALDPESEVWFTTSHGILNEIYYGRIDQACTRDMGLIVTDGAGFFSEEKRDAHHQIAMLAPGVPAFRMTNTCRQERYTIEKEVLADPVRECVLQQTRFTPLQGELSSYHLYVLLSPHLGNWGHNNTAWVSEYKGAPMLFARREGFCLALACSSPWLNSSVGFVGKSDGWQDIHQHGQMEWHYTRAQNGNVALTGEIDLAATGGEFNLVVGFGSTPGEAGHRALASLLTPFEEARDQYVREWEAWQRTLLPLEAKAESVRDIYRISTAVLRTHEAKNFPGGFIASLSIPWGEVRGDDDLGGYHLVWPRDLVETAGGLLAVGGKEDMNRVLHYLHTTQEPNGHWPQNMWMDGTFYWTGMQVDETALPILLLELAHREGALHDSDRQRLWPMVRRAAGFVARAGPVTDQDRWEEDAGYTAFTLAAEIAALLIAADLADLEGEKELAHYMRETADAWNASIERWTYVKDTDIARQVGVEGYYVRIAPPGLSTAGSSVRGYVQIKNRPPDDSARLAQNVVSPDTLALVRFGLRAPDDPRILNTIKVIDAMLKVETPYGTSWHRYNDDGYGEQKDGSPFEGIGIGRAWPLLTGERAHYELAAGNTQAAQSLMHAMESFADIGGMIPEQVWDSADIPGQGLYCGRPTGSAMPLVWAHAEYVKLRRSLRDGRVFDMPPQTLERYVKKKTGSRHTIWRYNNKTRHMSVGKTLRVETLSPATLRWTSDGWQTAHNTELQATGLGVYYADLPTAKLEAGSAVEFTFHWHMEDRWQGENFTVQVA